MVPMRPCSACGFEHPQGVAICPSTQQVIGAAVLDGRYRLEKLIAVGGIGAVYDARALHIDRRVAVKRLLPAYTADPEVVRRFQREARAAGRINHPNVVEVLDLGVAADGVPFLVMEFLEGDTLAARIERAPGQRLSADELVPVMIDVLAALGHAHSRNIIHRDLKPENVFLATLPTGATVIKVVDLGISKAIGSTSQAITQSGSALGTPHYMAPEQLRGEKDVDGRVDIYAAGIVLYRALSGVFPFDGRTFEQLVTRIMEGSCPPLSALVAGIAPGLSEAVAWAMHHDRDRRPASAEALAAALAPFAPPPAPRTSSQPHVPAVASASPGHPARPSAPSSPAAAGPPVPPVATPVIVIGGGPPETPTQRRVSPPAPVARPQAAVDFDVQTSGTIPVIAATVPAARRPTRFWLVAALVSAALCAGVLAAFFALRGGGGEPVPPPPPTGGLAGSPHADLAPPPDGFPSGDADAAESPLPEASAVSDAPAPPDAGPAPDAPAAPPADAGAPEAQAAGDEAGPAPREAVAEAAPPETTPAPEAARDAGRDQADAAPPADAPRRRDDAAPARPDVPAIDAAPAPDATPGRPDPAAVRAVFLRLQEGVRACADKEGPGAFHVSATVRGSDGRASRVDVRTGLSAGARDCVRDLVLATQFPTFGDEDASFLHSFDVPGPATADGGAADAGADAAVPTAQDVEHRLRRARREALGCTEGVTGHVRLTVHIDGRAQRATLVGVDGDVTDEQRECLRRVVEATEVPALPGEMTVPMVLQ